MSSKKSSSKRTIEMLVQMLRGDKLSMEDEMETYGRSKKAIQKSIADIRETLIEQNLNIEFIHDYNLKKYYLQKNSDLPFEEILALLAILIEARAFSKKELKTIQSHLLEHLSDDEQEQVKKLTNSTLAKYVPIKSDYDLLPRIKQFSEYINNNNAVEFKYLNSLNQLKKGMALPVSLYFDNFYFYIVMYDENNQNSHPYRLDRFKSIRKSTAKKIKIPKPLKKDDGKERNQTYLLNGGRYVDFEFYYSGFPQTALDRFPNSKIKKDLGNEVLIEASAYTQGILLWIMGQGARVRVKSPVSLVQEVKDELNETLKNYQ
ncbi:helix-turn-helix transcriptional regulator [Companilactobacillus sp. HBUAS59699]|uniref:helix-turn-helix transcriptional regulator n=1 Tax=Companilactobacillus sp. HBUAS59699 TaxID=3109358 RepID=UPI002FF22F65